jgi:protein SCO1/2
MRLDETTPEEEIARYIEQIRARPDQAELLVELLPQGHPLYAGRGANQVARIRGYLLASFETLGLSQNALTYALEELENSQDAYLVAASAKALRGLPNYSMELVPFLFEAITNIQYIDDAISFESYKPVWPLQQHTTALTEIFRTFKALGAYARPALERLQRLRSNRNFGAEVRQEISAAVEAIQSDQRDIPLPCCSIPTGKKRLPAAAALPKLATLDRIGSVQFQDQDERYVTFAEIFSEKPTVLGFFYTRCDNPNKCSLTITKLGQLQKRIAEQGLAGRIRIAAVSYDPGYDTPDKMKGYCQNRGFFLDQDSRALRADKDRFDELRNYFELGVNYSSSVVNRHQIELYLLNRNGEVATSYTNFRWHVEDVLGEARTMVANSAEGSSGLHSTSGLTRIAAHSWGVFVASMIVAFPKCPLCWAGYLSAMGLSGMASVTRSWILPSLLALMAIHLCILYRRASQRRIFLPLHLSSIGFASLAVAFASGLTFLRYLGLILVIAGAIANSFSFKTHLFLSRRFPVAAMLRSGVAAFRSILRTARSDVSSVSTAETDPFSRHG